MNIPTKKLKNGFEMPVFGIGTYNVLAENDNNVFLSDSDWQKEISTLSTAIEFGITHIDTAESYAQGNAEKLIGKVIQNFDRKKLFLTSKVKLDNLYYLGIQQALQSTLERMQTNYLDLYLMHRCPPIDKFEECVQAMNELIEKGLIKNIGLSNTNTSHTEMLCKISKHPFVVNQVHLNLQFREPERDGLVNFCQNNDMLLEAWRPVNKGALTKSGVNITKPGIPLLDALCKKYNKTPAQISINWLISQNNIVTLAKSSNIEHLKENLGSIGWFMDPEDIEKLKTEFPDQKFLSDTVPLS